MIRWIMLWAAWAGPIPLVHRHAFASNESIVSVETMPSWYRQHLRICHCEGCSQSDVEGKWHSHLLVPGTPEKPANSHAECQLDRVPSSVSATQILQQLQDHLCAVPIVVTSEFESAPRTTTPVVLTHFFEPTCPQFILTAHFCVSNC